MLSELCMTLPDMEFSILIYPRSINSLLSIYN